MTPAPNAPAPIYRCITGCDAVVSGPDQVCLGCAAEEARREAGR